MATIEQGILGPFTGKCGSVIGYLRNGQFCIRSMPTHYRDRRSPQQLQNRSRFTIVMKMMSLLRPVINLTFKHLATDMTEMNLATRKNYYSLVKPSGSGLQYNFPGLILSHGPVEPLTTPIHTLSGTTLHLHWDAQAIPGAGSDNVSLVLLNTQRKAMRFFRNIALRQDGTATIAIPTTWNREETYTYILVERHGDWSNTHCAGTIPWNQETTTANPSPSTPKKQQTFPQTNLDSHSHQTPIKLLFPSHQTRDHG